MPNITTISRLFTVTRRVTTFQSLPTHKKLSGTKKARAATATTMKAMYRPTNLLSFFNAFIVSFLPVVSHTILQNFRKKLLSQRII